MEWWTLQLLNAVVPQSGQLDPLRLAMAQGDRERLSAIKVRAAAHKRSQAKVKGQA